jgi:hypothetical protein
LSRSPWAHVAVVRSSSAHRRRWSKSGGTTQVVAETVWRAISRGFIGGVAGTAVMTLGEKIEQRFTGRPDSYVPARTMSRLFGLRRPNKKSLARNWVMHWGTGATLGVVRGVMANLGLRGPKSSAALLALRLFTDQSLENAMGVSDSPTQWPLDIAAIDTLHKGVYAFATGAAVDALLPARTSRRPALRGGPSDPAAGG